MNFFQKLFALGAKKETRLERRERRRVERAIQIGKYKRAIKSTNLSFVRSVILDWDVQDENDPFYAALRRHYFKLKEMETQ